MLATVVVITKNQRPFLERSLPMLFRQQDISGAVEVIVVDSGSTDGAQAVVKKYGAHLVEIAPQDFNYAIAYNLGIKRGKGRYIVRLSGDAVPTNDRWLSQLLAPMETASDIAVTWGSQQLPPDLKNPVEHWCARLYGYDMPDAQPVRVEKTQTVLGCNMATRRSLWEKYAFPTMPQAEDYAYLHYWLQHGFAGMFVPGAMVHHGHEEPIFRALGRSLIQSTLQGLVLAGVLPTRGQHISFLEKEDIIGIGT